MLEQHVAAEKDFWGALEKWGFAKAERSPFCRVDGEAFTASKGFTIRDRFGNRVEGFLELESRGDGSRDVHVTGWTRGHCVMHGGPFLGVLLRDVFAVRSVPFPQGGCEYLEIFAQREGNRCMKLVLATHTWSNGVIFRLDTAHEFAKEHADATAH